MWKKSGPPPHPLAKSGSSRLHPWKAVIRLPTTYKELGFWSLLACNTGPPTLQCQWRPQEEPGFPKTVTRCPSLSLLEWYPRKPSGEVRLFTLPSGRMVIPTVVWMETTWGAGILTTQVGMRNLPTYPLQMSEEVIRRTWTSTPVCSNGVKEALLVAQKNQSNKGLKQEKNYYLSFKKTRIYSYWQISHHIQ